ncbi:ACP phosphodiesterase [Flaviaesturariibacter aridisoli]|uniref:DUF479 domain-containing protein n=1 Tax=Flaviaesturariibacter aridisoli TaxID=2545761 RepID=A0A4R4DV23_9BACT|nr:ACP phosphodiesterase [Flaviaesturariibacter aridisoli]TCZ67083.1 DUF479 domain-containing protein [Flaviaesturariibacter aridisoli]
MNYLAHAYLSYGDPGLLVGNMISDFVKGRARFDYPPAIAAGIELHRRIDAFTDNHPATAAAKEFFRPRYRLYSGPIVDVVYDHFLANDAGAFPDFDHLERFTEKTYATIERHADALPEGFARIFPYMRQHNWLFNYRHSEGIGRSLAGLARRAAWMGSSDEAATLLTAHRAELRACYEAFAPDVKAFAKMEGAALRQG